MVDNPYGSVPKDRIEVLCRVREMIRSGKERYLCFAISKVRGKFPGLVAATHDIDRHIKLGLEGCLSLQVWTVKQVFPGSYFDLDLPQLYRTSYRNKGFIQSARLAWLDRLIETETNNLKENQDAH